MKECVKCGKQTNSCLPSDSGWLCYQCYDKHRPATPDKRTNLHEEDDIQEEFFKQASLFFPELGKLLFAVPNGGKRNKLEAVRLKRQGVRSGVADVILLIPKGGFSSLCIEFKTQIGKQSDEQKLFQQQASEVGNKYIVCRSASQAIEELKLYLQQKPL